MSPIPFQFTPAQASPEPPPLSLPAPQPPAQTDQRFDTHLEQARTDPRYESAATTSPDSPEPPTDAPAAEADASEPRALTASSDHEEEPTDTNEGDNTAVVAAGETQTPLREEPPAKQSDTLELTVADEAEDPDSEQAEGEGQEQTAQATTTEEPLVDQLAGDHDTQTQTRDQSAPGATTVDTEEPKNAPFEISTQAGSQNANADQTAAEQPTSPLAEATAELAGTVAAGVVEQGSGVAETSQIGRRRKQTPSTNETSQPTTTIAQSPHNGLVTTVITQAVQAAESASNGQTVDAKTASSETAPVETSASTEPSRTAQSHRLDSAERFTAPQAARGHVAEATELETISHTDRARFVQRVSRAFQIASDRGGEVRLRLAPPELGSLRLQVTLTDGTLNAKLEAETQTARNLLLDQIPILRDRLESQEIKLGKVDVGLLDLSQGGTQDTSGNHDPNSDGTGRRSGGQSSATPNVTEDPTHAPLDHRLQDGQLNVVI